MPSYESRITTSKLLLELENYEVIMLSSLVIVFLVFLTFKAMVVQLLYLLNIG